METIMNYVNDSTTSKTWGITLAAIMSAILLVSALIIPAYAEHTKELVVRAYTTSGKALSMYTVIRSGDTIVQTGFTPLSYTGITGNTYSVEVHNYKDLAFLKWGNDSTDNPRIITLSTNTAAVAYYKEGATSSTSTSTSSSAEPSVSLSFANLTEGQTLTGSLTFTVKASDHTKVNNIKAYVDGTTLLKEEKYDPYDFPLNTGSFSSGAHTLDAIATLKDGSIVKKSISVVFGGSTSTSSSSSTTDKFGVSMIHPTKSNGEQWFMNMANPASDPRFDPKSTITQNSDGSWNIKSTKVRMNVFTSSGYDSGKITTYNQQELAKKGYMQDPNDWRNVEITGFVKVNSTPSNDNFAWYARGGKHNDNNGGCEGTAYKGRLFYDGKAGFAKEQQHSDGYSFTKSLSVTNSLQGKWIGFKTVMYNNAQGNVVLQMWINENADKVTWKKVYEHTDSGGWGSDGDMCGGTPDQKITWGGPISTFRWDTATSVDFKWMSVREILPPA